MNSLLRFIEKSTTFIQEKIIEVIETDEYWLKELGIVIFESFDSHNIKNLIISKLEDLENYQRADKVIQYVLDDYVLGEDDSHSLFYCNCNVEAYSRNSALYVFKFNSNFYCYYLPERSLITSDPIPFCREAALEELSLFEIEKENMADEVWEDAEFTLELNWNFKLKFD
jgi:hypothetical protein